MADAESERATDRSQRETDNKGTAQKHREDKKNSAKYKWSTEPADEEGDNLKNEPHKRRVSYGTLREKPSEHVLLSWNNTVRDTDNTVRQRGNVRKTSLFPFLSCPCPSFDL